MIKYSHHFSLPAAQQNGDLMEEWITDYINQMTLDEKIGMIHGTALFKNNGVPRLGIPPLVMSDGPCGVRFDHEDSSWNIANDGMCECSWLPSGTAIASTWNTELAKQCGIVLGEEARGRGKDVILAPGINIHRTPLCGRNFEYMGEDPYLAGQIAANHIKGVQQCDVAVCVKHFALNNQEKDRMEVDVQVDERALFEIYLSAFKAAINEGNAYSVMCSYNKFQGQYVSESTYLLTDILKKYWNYDGVVISDWGAVHNTINSANAGVDLEMGVSTDFDNYYFAKPLKEAVIAGNIDEAVIDEKVSRILRLQKRLNIFEPSLRKKGCTNTTKHHQMLLDTSREAIVLLKNTDSILPINPDNVKKVAVIGDAAARRLAHGGGSSEVKALFEITPLLGINMAIGDHAEIHYAKGYYVDNENHTVGEVDWQASSLDAKPNRICGSNTNSAETDKIIKTIKLKDKLTKEALELAAECDTVIFVGGLNRAYDTEGFDRTSYDLPYDQSSLIRELIKVNPNTIVSITSGSAVNLSAFATNAKAILWSSMNGMFTGQALADVIFGKVNPSGHLPVSFPVKLTDCAAHSIGEYPGTTEPDGRKNCKYSEGLYVGYRHYSSHGIEPLFCFGHGLSYTTFEYSNLNIIENANKNFEVHFSIKNTGFCSGKETAQLYITPVNPLVDRPSLELKAFSKAEIASQDTIDINFTLELSDFAYYSADDKDFKTDPGEYIINIGSSCCDIRLKQTIVIL